MATSRCTQITTDDLLIPVMMVGDVPAIREADVLQTKGAVVVAIKRWISQFKAISATT